MADIPLITPNQYDSPTAGGAIGLKQADFLSKAGDSLMAQNEQYLNRAEAQMKAPAITQAYAQGMTRISQGDMGGFDMIANANQLATGNPFLMAMTKSANQEAAGMAERFMAEKQASARLGQQDESAAQRMDYAAYNDWLRSNTAGEQDYRKRLAEWNQKEAGRQEVIASGLPDPGQAPRPDPWTKLDMPRFMSKAMQEKVAQGFAPSQVGTLPAVRAAQAVEPPLPTGGATTLTPQARAMAAAPEPDTTPAMAGADSEESGENPATPESEASEAPSAAQAAPQVAPTQEVGTGATPPVLDESHPRNTKYLAQGKNLGFEPPNLPVNKETDLYPLGSPQAAAATAGKAAEVAAQAAQVAKQAASKAAPQEAPQSETSLDQKTMEDFYEAPAPDVAQPSGMPGTPSVPREVTAAQGKQIPTGIPVPFDQGKPSEAQSSKGEDSEGVPLRGTRTASKDELGKVLHRPNRTIVPIGALDVVFNRAITGDETESSKVVQTHTGPVTIKSKGSDSRKLFRMLDTLANNKDLAYEIGNATRDGKKVTMEQTDPNDRDSHYTAYVDGEPISEANPKAKGMKPHEAEVAGVPMTRPIQVPAGVGRLWAGDPKNDKEGISSLMQRMTQAGEVSTVPQNTKEEVHSWREDAINTKLMPLYKAGDMDQFRKELNVWDKGLKRVGSTGITQDDVKRRFANPDLAGVDLSEFIKAKEKPTALYTLNENKTKLEQAMSSDAKDYQDAVNAGNNGLAIEIRDRMAGRKSDLDAARTAFEKEKKGQDAAAAQKQAEYFGKIQLGV